MQIGNLDRLWRQTVGDPNSRFDLLSYNGGDGKTVGDRQLMNHFLVAGRNNPFFMRCHKLLLALWAADGGKTGTKGMRNSPLLKGLPMMSGGEFTLEENGVTIGPREVDEMLSDYVGSGITWRHDFIDER